MFGTLGPPESRYPPKENPDPKKRVAPKPGTAWHAAFIAITDMRCQHLETHVFDVLHGLGINPNAPWPPEADPLESEAPSE
jgi:hypothetical protein